MRVVIKDCNREWEKGREEGSKEQDDNAVSDNKIIAFDKAKNSAKHQGSVMKQKDRKLDALKSAFKASRDEVAKQRKNEASVAEKRRKNKKKRDGKKSKK